MTLAVLFVCGVVVAVAERAVVLRWYRRWFGQGLVGDMAIHFTIIRQLKKDFWARRIDQYLIALGPMSYPTGFHRLVMAFPLATLRRRLWLPNLLLTGLAGGLVLAYAGHLGPQVGLGAVAFATVVGVVVFLSTDSLVFHGPAIAYLGLSERLLGRLSCAATFGLVFADRYFGASGAAWVAVVTGAVAVLSSVFARQALLFSMPVLALVWWDPLPLEVTAAAFALALVLSPRHLALSMKHTVIQWQMYPTFMKPGRTQIGTLSHLVSPSELWRLRHQPRPLAEHLVRREPTRSLLAYPELVLVVVTLIVARDEPALDRLAVGPLVAAVVYAATSTRWLNHLGEAYRYLEFELLFTVPLLVARLLLGLPASETVLVLGGYVALVALAVALWVRVVPRFSRPVRGDELTAFLDGVAFEAPWVVYPVPMNVAGDVCARRADAQSFWWQPGLMDRRIPGEFFEEYPFLKKDYQPLARRYGVTLVLCDKEQMGVVDWAYDFSALPVVKEDPRFVLYDARRAGSGPDQGGGPATGRRPPPTPPAPGPVAALLGGPGRPAPPVGGGHRGRRRVRGPRGGRVLAMLLPLLETSVTAGPATSSSGRLTRWLEDAGFHGNHLLYAALAIFAVLGVLAALVSFFSRLLTERLRAQTEERLRGRMVRSLTKMSWPSYLQMRFGDITSAVMMRAASPASGCWPSCAAPGRPSSPPCSSCSPSSSTGRPRCSPWPSGWCWPCCTGPPAAGPRPTAASWPGATRTSATR